MHQRFFKRPSLFVAALLAFLFLALGSTAQAQAQAKPDYPLGAGDAIRIQVFQNPDLTIEPGFQKTAPSPTR